MQRNNNLKNNPIRTGTVTEVNYKNCSVRVLFSDEDLPPDNNPDTEVKQFSDGTLVSYDTKKHELTIKCMQDGVIKVEAKTIKFKADTTTIDGDLAVTGSITAAKEISSKTRVSAPAGEFGAAGANGSGLKVNGKDWLEHIHSSGDLVSPHGPVSGSTGEGKA